MSKLYFAEVWNTAIEREQKEVTPRARIYASELGGSFIDRYLKMTGTPYTNPPNSRSMRKFMAGDIWEWIVRTVLEKSGIEFTTQDKVLVEYEGLLPISGKVDFIVTGNIKEGKVDATLPDFMQKVSDEVLLFLKKKKFQKSILEIKSVSSFIFESVLITKKPKLLHILQAGLYKKATGLPTDIIYICRDDVRIFQYSIDDNFENIENMIKEDVKMMTYYYNNNIIPPKESLIIWDEDLKKFTKNWKVEYSNYLSMLYSVIIDGKEIFFSTPDQYSKWASKLVSSFNRVLKRKAEGKKMTEKNLLALEEMRKFGFNPDTIKVESLPFEEELEEDE